MTITALPSAPLPTDNTATFNSKAFALVAALNTFVTEANVTEAEVDADAASALDSKISAKLSENASVAAANYKGAYSGLTGALSIPASVSHLSKVWVLTQSVANVTLEVPGTSAKWLAVSVNFDSPGVIGGVTPSVGNFTSVNTPNTFGFKNRIINGDMRIDQRNAGAAVTAGSGNVYSLDRWKMVYSVDNKFTVQQQLNPTGIPFGACAQITSSSTYSVGTGDIFAIRQAIEGFNSADLKWGTSLASAINISFYVNSSLTGTFGGSVQNSATNRSYPFSYVISTANTWTQISITIPGDTSGTWLSNNGVGIWLSFGLGSGSTYSGTSGSWTSSSKYTATGAVSVVGTNGATFYITGVQFEVGSVATSFDVRDYGRELIMCQRYCQWVPFSMGFVAYTASEGVTNSVPFKTDMRTTPSFSTISVDPNSTGSTQYNLVSSFAAGFSSTTSGLANLIAIATGNTFVYGYRSLATSEL